LSDATAEFFAELERRSYEPLLDKLKGTIRFDIVDGKRTRRWLVSVDRGTVDVSRGNAAADTAIRIDRALFERLVTGKANAMAEMLRGRIGFQGDPSFAIIFQRLFPGPPLTGGKR
jgi:putative sterol carrier protein